MTTDVQQYLEMTVTQRARHLLTVGVRAQSYTDGPTLRRLFCAYVPGFEPIPVKGFETEDAAIAAGVRWLRGLAGEVPA